LSVRQVLVFISATTARATPIPPELVSRMQRFAPEDAERAAPARRSRTRRRAEG